MYFLDYKKKNTRQSSFAFSGNILSHLKQTDAVLWSIWRRLTDHVAVTTASSLKTFCVPPGQDLYPPQTSHLEVHPEHCVTLTLFCAEHLQVSSDLYLFCLYFYFYFGRFLDPYYLLKAQLLKAESIHSSFTWTKSLYVRSGNDVKRNLCDSPKLSKADGGDISDGSSKPLF